MVADEVARSQISSKLSSGLVGQPLLMPVSIKVDDDWQEDDLFDELELDPPPKRSKKVQYGLGVVLIILLFILAIALAFPELVAI